MKTTTIVTSMYNRSQGVLEIIDKLFFTSLLRNGDLNTELIILDDCSPFQIQTDTIIGKYLPILKKIFGSVIFVRNESNLGFAKSFNKGIKMASGERLLIANDDLYFPKGSIQKLVETLLNPDYLLVGPISNNKELFSFQYCEQAPKLNSYFPQETERLELFSEFLKQKMHGQIKKTDDLCGFCFATDTAFLKEIGGFNENYKHGFWEDIELIKKINKEYGYGKTAINMEVFVGHRGIKEGASSFMQQPLKAAYYFLINSFKYANTWGYGKTLERMTFGLRSQISGKGTISELLPKEIKF
jgi:GT2 family glycosyltransferase